MATLPLQPHLRHYKGSKEKRRREDAAFNATAQRVADYVNALVAHNTRDTQVYMFYSIASALGLAEEIVREAISDGGHNGITFGVTDEDRRRLEPYRRSS